MTNVVVFSGGRGAATILRSLARTRNVRLSVVINAYDSGLSTGRVRRAVNGMLGPSDVRKTADALVGAVGDPSSRRLAALLETRLSMSAGDARTGANSEAEFAAILDERFDLVDESLVPLLCNLTLATWSQLRESLTCFQKHLVSGDHAFDYDDLALGNAVLAGMYVEAGFNGAMSAYQDLLGLEDQRVLNVSNGENLWLSATAGEYVCPDEGVLVAEEPPEPISDLYLLSRADHDRLFAGHHRWWSDCALATSLHEWETLPALNDEVAEAIAQADVIVYGPGTQHSSLFPSYLTVGLCETIRENRTAEKMFVVNINRDSDQHREEGLRDTLQKFRYFMSRRGSVELDYTDLISTVLANDDDMEHLQFLSEAIKRRPAAWADSNGRHSGPALKEEISSVIRQRSGEHLSGDTGMVSVIVPVLDEQPRIGAVLQQLRYLDLGAQDLVHEIIVVDGGSTDGTLDVLRSEPDIRMVEASCSGRGEAIHHGLKAARGEYVVVFPGDGEYDVLSVAEVTRELTKDAKNVVLASRTLGGSSASQRLRAVYGENRLLYMLSHWGGTIVTLMLMVKLDRIVSDPLSSVRGARHDVFGQLDNAASGLDYDVQWVKRAVEAGQRVVEIPVDYRPRSWRDGKKANVWDGLQALRAVFQSSRAAG
jgi:2-phospho-L-lactate transferase/gluconeogenesis factor (CofD/UPF0052 family)